MRKHHAPGFTLIELLVVVTIIVVLIAILLPSLNKAIAAANLSVCLSNQRQINNAALTYTADRQGQHAAYSNWTSLIGKRGTSTAYDSNLYGLDDRPLNPYAGNAVDIARCPGDLGDTHPTFGNTITNCFEQYGNSYCPPWSQDFFRASLVFGVPGGTPAKRITDFRSAANKVVIGEMAWWLNRPWANPRTRWHDTGPVRSVPIAFADGHAGVIRVSPEHEAEGSTSGTLFAPNPGFIFW